MVGNGLTQFSSMFRFYTPGKRHLVFGRFQGV